MVTIPKPPKLKGLLRGEGKGKARGFPVSEQLLLQNTKVGYFGDAEGVQAIVPAGTLVVFSSLVFHCSSPNRTSSMRRAYVTQYSPEVIFDPATDTPKHLDVPFLENGTIIYNG